MKKTQEEQQPAPTTGEMLLEELRQRENARKRFLPRQSKKQGDGLSEDRRTMLSYYRNFNRRYFLND